MNKMTSDPYRATPLRPPMLTDDDQPVAGPVTVLAYVDRYPPHVLAGAETMLHSMLRWLVQERGVRCMVATAVDAPHVYEGVEVFPVSAVKALAGYADVVIGHLQWTREVCELADAFRLPLVYVLHNDNQIRHWKLKPENVTAMIWNTEWIEASCQAQGWPASWPSIICRPPVLPSEYRTVGLDHHSCEFVTLVNPNPEKGSGTFYECARRRHRLTFLAVEGAYGTQIRPREIGNVKWQRPTVNMRDDVYARTRIQLVPSVYESFGRVAVEALCAGIPVVAHPTDGLVEALGPAGIFVDRADVDQWVKWIDALTNDRDVYRSWSKAATARGDELWGHAVATDLPAFESLVRRCAAVCRRVNAV